MRITSIAFNNNDIIPPRYKGATNPPINISHVPKSAQSLALVMYDPDAISGHFVHWAIWDIAPTTTTILENNPPSGAILGRTSSGAYSYIGPRPPKGSGRHHYTFELFALDSVIDLLPSTPHEILIKTIHQHLIEKTSLVGIIDA